MIPPTMAPTSVPEDVFGVPDELGEVRAVVVVELVSVLTGARMRMA